MCLSENGVYNVFQKFCLQKMCSDGKIGEAAELEGKLCDEVVMERKLAYVGYGVSADGGCEAAVTARTSCMLFKFR